MPQPSAGNVAPALLAAVRKREADFVERLSTLVQMESPSSSKSAVDQAQAVFAAWATEVGGKVRRHRFSGFGDSLAISFGHRSSSESPILLLGHMDTVYETGTLARMPFKVTRDRIAGPGVLDMKAGVLMALTALETLKESQQPHRPVTLLLHGDEEIGSPASRALTEEQALRSAAVYVLEPAQGETGAYKTARKGVGRYRLTVTGKAAHSGVDFEKGQSAIVEIAHQITVLSGYSDVAKGTTINPGIVAGGTNSNVIAAQAWVEIDVRASRMQDAVRIDRALRGLKPLNKGCTLTVEGEINRPPMERTRGTGALFRRAQGLAAQLGFHLDEASTGGASDGNFTAALGVPTLDGMGAVGAGAHAAHEHLLRKHLAPRIALLAGMLL